jgi:hypothetical protein
MIWPGRPWPAPALTGLTALMVLVGSGCSDGAMLAAEDAAAEDALTCQAACAPHGDGGFDLAAPPGKDAPAAEALQPQPIDGGLPPVDASLSPVDAPGLTQPPDAGSGAGTQTCRPCIWGQTFESSNGGFRTTSDPIWVWGIPASVPFAAHSGRYVWAADVTDKSSFGTIVSPPIDLRAYAGSDIAVGWWQESELTPSDGATTFGFNKDADLGPWSTVGLVSHQRTMGPWRRVEVIVDAADIDTARFAINFGLSSGYSSWASARLRIDDVCIAPVRPPSYRADFNLSDGGYTVSGQSSWEWGTAISGGTGQPLGVRLWKTHLSGEYSPNEDGYLTSPEIDLSALAAEPGLVLRWWQGLVAESGHDFGSVEASADGGESWASVWGPWSSGSDQESVALGPEYATANFRVRFHFTSDAFGSTWAPGWTLRRVTLASVTETSCEPTADSPMSGKLDGGAGSAFPDARGPSDGADAAPDQPGPTPACMTCAWGETFDSTNGGFTVSGALTSWEWGAPTSGPGGARSGKNVWATSLAGNYRSGEDGYLTSPIIDVSAYPGRDLTVSWWEWLEMLCDHCATFELSTDGGATWNQVTYNELGPQYRWTRNAFHLDYRDVPNGTVRLRFHFVTERFGSTLAGWYIDDLCVAPSSPLGYYADFRADDGGFESSNPATWAWGPAVTALFPQGGRDLWATNLSGPHTQAQDGYLTSPVLDLSRLSALDSLTVKWRDWLQTDTGHGSASIDLSTDGGATWQTPWSSLSDSGGEARGRGQIFGWLDTSSPCRLRFHFVADALSPDSAWQIADVSIQGHDTPSCDPSSGGGAKQDIGR